LKLTGLISGKTLSSFWISLSTLLITGLTFLLLIVINSLRGTSCAFSCLNLLANSILRRLFSVNGIHLRLSFCFSLLRSLIISFVLRSFWCLALCLSYKSLNASQAKETALIFSFNLLLSEFNCFIVFSEDLIFSESSLIILFNFSISLCNDSFSFEILSFSLFEEATIIFISSNWSINCWFSFLKVSKFISLSIILTSGLLWSSVIFSMNSFISSFGIIFLSFLST